MEGREWERMGISFCVGVSGGGFFFCSLMSAMVCDRRRSVALSDVFNVLFSSISCWQCLLMASLKEGRIAQVVKRY